MNYAWFPAFILRAARSDPVSVALFLPYLAWLAFASVLNSEIWRLN